MITKNRSKIIIANSKVAILWIFSAYKYENLKKKLEEKKVYEQLLKKSLSRTESEKIR